MAPPPLPPHLADRPPLTPGERQLVAGFVARVRGAPGAGTIERVLVFGSRARGEGHADSDLDLAVFATADAPADGHRLLAELAQEVQRGHEDLPHLRPLLIRAGDPVNPALRRAIDREGIELWATKID